MRINGETVDQIGASVLGNIQQTAAWAGLAHALYVLVHHMPIIPLANLMVSPIWIKMSPDWVSVEGDEDDVD